MDFKLKKPCKDCPFLRTKSYLSKERALEIGNYTRQDNATFTCHKTLKSEHQHCAGALIMAEKLGRKGNMQQVAVRLGFYDPAELDMDADIYETPEEMAIGHDMRHGRSLP